MVHEDRARARPAGGDPLLQLLELVAVRRCLQRLDRHGPVLVAHLLGAHRERHVALARAHGQHCQMKRGGGRGAGVLNVDDRLAQQAGVAQRHLPAHAFLRAEQPARRVAEEDHADLVGRGVSVGERCRRRLGRERAQVRVQELAEPGHSRPADHHLAHVIPPRMSAASARLRP